MGGCTTPLDLCEPHPDRPNRRLVMSPTDSFDGGKRYVVPCGNCMSCRLNRARERAVRGVHESKMHKSNLFLTLTYDPEHLPEDLSVSLPHHQQFCRSLRYHAGPFRYDMCAEYSPLRMRAHYHYIGYGLALPDLVPWGRSKSDELLYTSATLDKAWGKGLAFVGEVNMQSIEYVNRYTQKKILEAEQPEDVLAFNGLTGEFSRLAPEFRRSSTDPGIGIPFFERWRSDFARGDFCVINGRKYPVPQLYLRHLAAADHRAIKVDRAALVERRYQSQIERGLPDERGARRLMTRHESQLRRAKRLIRGLDAEL